MPQETKSARFILAIEPSLLAAVDRWRSKQPGIPSRAEAMRRLVRQSLETK